MLLAFTSLAAVAVAVLAYVATERQRRQAEQTAAAGLRRTIDLLCPIIAGAGANDPDRLQQILQQAEQATGDRFTLIDRRGEPLASSNGGRIGGVAQRPEVIAALSGQAGADRRVDPADGLPVLFAARPVAEGGAANVLAGARPLGPIEKQLSRFYWRLFAVGVLLVLLFALAASALVRHIVRPVLSLNAVAEAISSGDYRQRAFVANNDELGQLAKSFNRMSRELGSQLVELREGGQRQATVLEGMIEGVVAVDDRQRVLFANTAAGDLFSFIPPQVQGRPMLEVVRHHTLHQSVVTGLSTGRPQRLEIEWEGPDLRNLLVQVTPLPGKPCPGVVVVLHDTTELRRLETLRQDFVANVSHELKTPLSSIKAFTETLLGGALNDAENNVNFLRRIEEQADRLDNLIQDMLALARIETAQQPFEVKPVRLSEVAASCVDDYRTRAEAKQIVLVSGAADPELRVTADPEGLRVILNNLIDNAIKYTPVGGKVVVRWRRGEEGSALIDVQDTGIGIPQAELPRVFERFYRVDKARSRDVGGTGLGLAIVKHLAQAFAGSVSVDSSEGEGTTFTVELPTA